jgi:hypothetical protein
MTTISAAGTEVFGTATQQVELMYNWLQSIPSFVVMLVGWILL